MSKIKINVANGTVMEKPLITCFKGTTGDYIVLDNETNGQMGYPIICISKFNGTSLEKIVDPNEWSSVKENLKTIIAGTALPYLEVPSEVTANDEFFTQLTLPVASFDLLKNSYSVPSATQEIAPAAPTMENVAPTPEITPSPVPVEPSLNNDGANVIAPAPVPEMPAAPEVAPAPAAPTEEPMISAPVIAPEAETPGVTPAVEPAPEIPVAPSITPPTGNDYSAIKDSFMKSCENMFDALIKQLENK